MRISPFPSPTGRSMVAVAAALVGALVGPSRAWSVSGTVKNASGAPIPGVAITVKDSASYTTTSSSTGTFSLSSVSGTLEMDRFRSSSAKVVGNELLIEGMTDGSLDLALLDGSGRRLWASQGTASHGLARIAIPTGIRSGAAYLRIEHSTGVFDLGVIVGADGWKVARHIAAMRSLAAGIPTLVFKKTGYRDTSFTPSTETATGVTVVLDTNTTCPFPTTFKWKDYGSAVASPIGNNWVSIKDFTNVIYNGQHLVYASTHDQSKYGSMGMSLFTNWADASKATQTKMNVSVVAPELMYFTPKKQWILSYQWGSAKFNYMTSTDPTKVNSWGASSALLSEDITKADGAEYGPIDQVPICDATTCYLFYAGDNGHIYRASMPIGNFPGVFSGSKSILQDTKANLFEAVEVYTVKGTGKYLMIVECMGNARYFRAFSATSLGGTWTPISNATGENTPFAGRKNISNPPSWTNDISHGDLVRSADETRTVDPCNLQLLYQGYAASFTGAYDLKPYKLGLLTFEGK
ncbi:MAG: carboxypeptidase regulatory-like domain-containing protein [Fibrobacteres bacterium]|nr:carboxypeptidase regulatory-like domain-containing protein [Fibrobacterota bacterium]